MSETAKLLTPPTNYAVVQLPGRQFPGVVFQGDSLNTLVNNLSRVLDQFRDPGQVAAALEELEIIRDDLAEIRGGYERVLEQQGIALPYGPKDV